jgi:hypothetical protein
VKAERQHVDRRSDDEKNLLVEAERGLVETAHEQERQRETQDERHRARRHDPRRAHRQRTLFAFRFSQRVLPLPFPLT